MSDNLFTLLFQHMDIAVCEAKHDGSLVLLSKAPAWLLQFEPGLHKAAQKISLSQRSPFLENFLIDANNLWLNESSDTCRSGPWLETGYDGQEYSLEASAMLIQGKHILTLQYLNESYQQHVHTLQIARENLITNEQLEEQVRIRTAQIRQREEQIAMRLLAAAGFRDEETGAHVRRIGLYSGVIGKALGWDKQRIDNIRIAAPMHDIGKIGIPDSILKKPGKLIPDEYTIMKDHATIGALMLGGSDIPLLTMASEIAKYHHEKWDGSGYPEGLSGNDIPISARIVALTDVYDALVHKRCYKEPFPEVEVLDYLQQQSGKHFDPKLVVLFMDVLDEIQRIKDEVKEGEQGWDYSKD